MFTIDRPKDSGNRIRTADDTAATMTSVEAVTLDETLSGSYAFGKLDVEGAEPLALSGARRMLGQHNPPVWQLELVDRFVRRFGWTSEGLRALLHSHGYELSLYDADAGELRAVKDDGESPTNVLAIAKDARDFVTRRLSESSP